MESQTNSIASQRSVHVDNHLKQNIQLLHYRHLAVVYELVIFREGRREGFESKIDELLRWKRSASVDLDLDSGDFLTLEF